MVIQLQSILFAALISGLTYLEERKYHNILTPFTLSAWPFVFIILLNNLILRYFKFNPVTTEAMIFIFINLFIIWLVGYLLSFIYNNNGEIIGENQIKRVFKDVSNFQYVIILLSWLVVFLNFYKAKSLIDQFGGFWILADQRFENSMVQGPIAHFIEIGKVCFVFLIFTWHYAKSKWLYSFTLAALFFAIALVQVKYHLFWLLIISVVFFNINRPVKKQLKKVFVMVFSLFFVLIMFWIFSTLVWGTFSFENKGVWEFIFGHFFTYLVSGPVVLNNWLEFGNIKPDWSLFVVFFNITNVLIGEIQMIDAVPLVSHGFHYIAPNLHANIGTSFGVYYLIGDYYFSFFMVIIIASISYLLYIKSRTTKSEIVIFFNILFLMLSSLNFFVQYFTLLSIYEFSLIFVFFILLFITSIRLKKIIHLKI